MASQANGIIVDQTVLVKGNDDPKFVEAVREACEFAVQALRAESDEDFAVLQSLTGKRMFDVCDAGDDSSEDNIESLAQWMLGDDAETLTERGLDLGRGIAPTAFERRALKEILDLDSATIVWIVTGCEGQMEPLDLSDPKFPAKYIRRVLKIFCTPSQRYNARELGIVETKPPTKRQLDKSIDARKKAPVIPGDSAKPLPIASRQQLAAMSELETEKTRLPYTLANCMGSASNERYTGSLSCDGWKAPKIGAFFEGTNSGKPVFSLDLRVSKASFPGEIRGFSGLLAKPLPSSFKLEERMAKGEPTTMTTAWAMAVANELTELDHFTSQVRFMAPVKVAAGFRDAHERRTRVVNAGLWDEAVKLFRSRRDNDGEVWDKPIRWVKIGENLIWTPVKPEPWDAKRPGFPKTRLVQTSVEVQLETPEQMIAADHPRRIAVSVVVRGTPWTDSFKRVSASLIKAGYVLDIGQVVRFEQASWRGADPDQDSMVEVEEFWVPGPRLLQSKAPAIVRMGGKAVKLTVQRG